LSKKHLIAAMLVAAASLAWSQGQSDRADRRAIDVTIVNGRIVVEEEVAVTTREHGGLVWRIVTAGYVFPENGIELQSNGKHRCRVMNDARFYRCGKLRHDAGERYKYNVNVVSSQSGRALEPLDPWIQND
jgi:hypothetical protein